MRFGRGPSGRRGTRPTWGVVALLVAGSGAVLAGILSLSRASDAPTNEIRATFTVGSGDRKPIFVSGAQVDSLIRPGEKHFRHLWQLTNGGENAEAYFSFDGEALVFQATPRGGECDQIYTMSAEGGPPTLVSTGKGRCTCAYFLPGDDEIVFASTHLAADGCPSAPDHSQGYVWGLSEGYEIWRAKRDGTGLVRLTDSPGYDAEATVGPDGTIIFTSVRDGDLELYSMGRDGSNVRRLTNTPGYDGGAFFSADGKKICWRAGRPKDAAELEDFRGLLAQGLVRPSRLEIYVADADGSNQKMVTSNGAANFCPFFHPSGRSLIFASNFGDPRGRNFDLYQLDLETGEVAPVTTDATFDGFPMFSPDGGRLVFASNRGSEREGETNLFMAEWVD